MTASGQFEKRVAILQEKAFGLAKSTFPSQSRQDSDRADDAMLIESDRTLPLKSSVKMMLTAYRDKDRLHHRVMISIGLIRTTCCSQLPEEFSQRLQQLLDNPVG